MVADIFYLMFTLKITVLAYFIQKKKIRDLASTRASPWTPWLAYSSPHTPSCKKKTMHPYFFSFSPLSPGSVGLH